MQLQQHVEAALPAPINTACQIIRWQDDALLLAVPTSAHSAKLRQLLPRLADALQSRGWQINEIRVRVQAPTRLPAPPAPLSPEQRPYITPDGLTAFAELAAQLPAQGPLAQSLARLLQRRQA